ncbi:putative periplasmic serine endoprotease DegP-like precursor [Methyloligella halotolerans]|uniref:Probable periplasmic serine endoprotease DegP-like n=1 Tax=Methyloligella halotolerans TaxID=1177755 RepID=A0A1E2RXE5_9HYPH|nr:Do family serine endopeptidase [Methyloligella halotolerans]ODA66822.1 putative periplasmic serine endoprotease DegP-like precursor [Methyloligella halotolerans]
MQSNDTRSNAPESPRKGRFFRRPAMFAVALIGAGALGFAMADSVPFASAEPVPTSPPATTMAPNFADLVKKVSPAVVSINVKGNTEEADGEFDIPGMPDIPKDSPFYEFFKRFGQIPKGMPHQPHPVQAQGSGFFISPDGYLVTNNHVVEDADEITVTMEDGATYDAELVGNDPRTDVALLKVDGKELPYVEFSDKDPQVGEWVLAVGNPFGLGGTVTAGIISAHNRDIGSGPYDYLQIDAAVNRGNSGGPSFTLDGKVVGMNTAIFSPSGGNVGIAFAVPAALVKEVVGQLKTSGSVDRGWLGVVIQNVTDDLADGVGLDEAKGALVSKVSEDGPAAEEGIEAGDVITAVNGETVEDSRDLARKIADLEPDTDVKLTVNRYGDEREVNVTLGKFPSGKQLAKLQGDESPAEDSNGEEMKDLGLSVAPASSMPGAGEEGVVITEIEPDSDAADKGLSVGDVILQVGGKDVETAKDISDGIRATMSKPKNKGKEKVNVIFRIKSGDRMSFVALALKNQA